VSNSQIKSNQILQLNFIYLKARAFTNIRFRHICMAHAEMCARDKVCLLEGLNAPIILRSLGKRNYLSGGRWDLPDRSKLDKLQPKEEVP
jgi:hypothetical protein